jgi:hypothetical protein
MKLPLRHSTAFFLFCTLCLLTISLLALHAATASGADNTGNRKLAAKLKLTDLCIFTEARYTRHPAMADHHAAFQDHPAALEHFPSGALLIPPANQGRKN